MRCLAVAGATGLTEGLGEVAAMRCWLECIACKGQGKSHGVGRGFLVRRSCFPGCGLLGGAGDFLESSRFATETAEVEELGAADFVGANLLDLIDDLGVVGEDALDALAEAHLANGEGTLCALAACDDHAFEGLEALFLAFLDLDLDANGVAGCEFR